MFSIQNIIYGIPLTEKLYNRFRDAFDEYDELDDDLDLEAMGFEFLYSGCATWVPGFLGVCLGKLDESLSHVKIDGDKFEFKDRRGKNKSFSLIPTQQQIDEVLAKIEKLPDSVKEMIPDVGIYIVYSTS